MLTTSGILTLAATVLGSAICCFVLVLSLKEFLKIRISNTILLLFGISIMVFDAAVLKDLVPYGFDIFFSAIAFGFCICGFVMGIYIKNKK